uniref:Ig-like domain-containing protein n=1 Tax=Oryzias latipes TaxID=8090 RepID=A0A3B3I965_ORYLA
IAASPVTLCVCLRQLFFLFSLFPGEPIIAAPGDDVILPCRLDSQEDLSGFSVEWTKVDMKPDPQGRILFVYLYWSRQTMTTVMIPSLIPRVSLDQDGLKRGDVTLKIRNVSLQDEGKYRCFIPGKNFRETVQLVVGEFALQVLPHMKNICPEQQAGNDVISLFQSQTERRPDLDQSLQTGSLDPSWTFSLSDPESSVSNILCFLHVGSGTYGNL